jgi:hypothetical protein
MQDTNTQVNKYLYNKGSTNKHIYNILGCWCGAIYQL